MPTYNQEKYIADSIRSVLAQNYSDWELIVVDDGSTDTTATIVRDFVCSDKRIKYIFQQHSRLGKARNTGIRNSTGNVIAFLDSDDLWIETKIEAQIGVITEANVDVVFSDSYVFSEENAADETKTLKSSEGLFSGPDFFDSLVQKNQIPVLTVLLKRTALERVGLFEEAEAFHGCEDYDLWLRLAKANCVFYGMQAVLARYRRHETAMTARRSNELIPTLTVVRRHLQHSSLSEFENQKRIASLYRELIAALVEEGNISEAKQFLNEHCSWNKNNIVTQFQRLLLTISPRHYNFISRECLYRIEWHFLNTFRSRQVCV